VDEKSSRKVSIEDIVALNSTLKAAGPSEAHLDDSFGRLVSSAAASDSHGSPCHAVSDVPNSAAANSSLQSFSNETDVPKFLKSTSISADSEDSVAIACCVPPATLKTSSAAPAPSSCSSSKDLQHGHGTSLDDFMCLQNTHYTGLPCTEVAESYSVIAVGCDAMQSARIKASQPEGYRKADHNAAHSTSKTAESAAINRNGRERGRPEAKGLPSLLIVSKPEELRDIPRGVIVMDRKSLRKSDLAVTARLHAARMHLCDSLLQVRVSHLVPFFLHRRHISTLQELYCNYHCVGTHI
jgi:hypothetical protein